MKKKKIIFIVVSFVILVGGGVWFFGGFMVKYKVIYVMVIVSKGEILELVIVIGIIELVIEVEVGI